MARLRSSLLGMSLAMRFALASFIVILGGMLGVGAWVAGRIEDGVVARSASTAALYVDSFVAPHVQGLTPEGELAAGDRWAWVVARRSAGVAAARPLAPVDDDGLAARERRGKFGAQARTLGHGRKGGHEDGTGGDKGGQARHRGSSLRTTMLVANRHLLCSVSIRN